MSGTLPRLMHGPASYQVAADVLGGQLVVPDGGDDTLVNVAGADATNVLGVAANDAKTAASISTDPVDYSHPRDHVSVYYGGREMRVTFAAAAAFGELVKAAANGQVTPYTPSGTAPSTDNQIVGRCTQPGGVGVGEVGLMRIYV